MSTPDIILWECRARSARFGVWGLSSWVLGSLLPNARLQTLNARRERY
jgi:hypothetical protein